MSSQLSQQPSHSATADNSSASVLNFFNSTSMSTPSLDDLINLEDCFASTVSTPPLQDSDVDIGAEEMLTELLGFSNAGVNVKSEFPFGDEYLQVEASAPTSPHSSFNCGSSSFNDNEDDTQSVSSSRKRSAAAGLGESKNKRQRKRKPRISELSDEQKKDKRARNKLAAEKCRLKKRTEIETKEARVQEISQENSLLRDQLKALMTEVQYLRGLLPEAAAHRVIPTL